MEKKSKGCIITISKWVGLKTLELPKSGSMKPTYSAVNVC